MYFLRRCSRCLIRHTIVVEQYRKAAFSFDIEKHFKCKRHNPVVNTRNIPCLHRLRLVGLPRLNRTTCRVSLRRSTALEVFPLLLLSR